MVGLFESDSLPVDSGPTLDLGLIKGDHVLDDIKPLLLTDSLKDGFFPRFNVCNHVGSMMEVVDSKAFTLSELLWVV